MSKFGTTLKALMEQNHRSAAELSRITGINQSSFSRWIKGDQGSIALADFERVAPAVSSAPEQQAQLLRALLLDNCSGPGSDLLEITIRNAPAELHDIPMPTGLKDALAALGDWAKDDDEVRQVVTHLANIWHKRLQEEARKKHDLLNPVRPEKQVEYKIKKKPNP